MRIAMAVLMTLWFLTGSAMAADSSSPKLHSTGKGKHHKHKTTLNPQPLPPAKVPVDGNGGNGPAPGSAKTQQ
jgi:hypothetical protein